ncbi:Crocetin glucosyltransferase, chloroplastic, partial [Mucuna pruriens]
MPLPCPSSSLSCTLSKRESISKCSITRHHHHASPPLQIPTALLWIQPATILDIYYYYFDGNGEYMKGKMKETWCCSVELPGLPLLVEPLDLASFLLGLNPAYDTLMLSKFEEQFDDLDVETKARVLVEQKTNATLIEHVWKTEREEIKRCLEVVMGTGNKGQELRNNAKKWKALNQGGSSDKNLRAFLDDVSP